MTSLFDLIQIGSIWMLIYSGCISSTIISDDATSDENSSEIPIIRQINKVNDDGTYTYGYEAADGSFKIETRDVLGNVKGMFGFIDETGELKRVSYTASNSTGFRPKTSTDMPTRVPIISSGYTTVRSTPTQDPSVRRPVLILKNTPISSSNVPVIQHIPKKVTQETDEDSMTTTTATTTIGFGEYINGRRIPHPIRTNKANTTDDFSDDQQQNVQNLNPLRKVLVSKRPVEDKDTSKGKGGNALRRQLGGGFDFRAGDTNHVYSGGDQVPNYFASSNMPPHLTTLVSELSPIQATRAAYIASETYAPSSSENYGYGYARLDHEVPVSPGDITEYPSAITTEIPNVSNKYRLTKGRRLTSVDETRYPITEDATYQPRQTTTAPQIRPLRDNYPVVQPPSNYYDSTGYSIAQSLRDELVAIIHNYLQARLPSVVENSYYGPPPLNRPPAIPYQQPNNEYFHYPYINQNFIPPPYRNFPPVYPYPPLYYPPPLFNPVPIYPTQRVNPNIQSSSRHPNSVRNTPESRIQTVRSTISDDADLLQMLLTSPTRIPVHQLKYSENSSSAEATETSEYHRPNQPVRNVQIISESTSSRPLTTDRSK